MSEFVIEPSTHVEVSLDGKTCVRDILNLDPYKEKRRYFKSRTSAARKLREEFAEIIADQAEAKEDEEYTIEWDISENINKMEGSPFEEETRQAREEMESGKEKSEYPFEQGETS